MRRRIQVEAEKPQFCVTTGITFAQADAWFGNTVQDLKLDLIYPRDNTRKYPCVVWICGGAWIQMDRSAHLAYLSVLAQQGFVVASVEYRTSNEAKFPAPLQDVKAGIRYLRAHADRFNIDPDRIGIIGRSAGGHLSALAAMNSDLYESEEWSGYSSKVQACCDMFGPVDFLKLIEIDEHEIATNPNFRWKSMAETHEGALMGGDPATLRERSKEFCPPYILTKEMCPMLILHGDCDKLVPCSISEEFYDKIVEAGMEDRADLYILAGAGHGTKEFFQPETKEIICAFFDKNLK